LHPLEPIGDHQNNGSRFAASQDHPAKVCLSWSGLSWLHPVEPIGDHQNNGSRFKASQDPTGSPRAKVGLFRFGCSGCIRLNQLETIKTTVHGLKLRRIPQDHHGQRSVYPGLVCFGFLPLETIKTMVHGLKLRRITRQRSVCVAWLLLDRFIFIGSFASGSCHWRPSKQRFTVQSFAGSHRITTGKGRFVPVGLLRLHPVEPIGDHQNNGSRFKASQDPTGSPRAKVGLWPGCTWIDLFSLVRLLLVPAIGDHQNNGSRVEALQDPTGSARAKVGLFHLIDFFIYGSHRITTGKGRFILVWFAPVASS
jgi:hypothetical protein